jgi:riboflavin kinase/FMN adenylyltransferase
MEIIKGKVLEGKGLGRQFGFPTVNVFYNGEERGVFAGKVFLRNSWHPAAINIGVRPTVDNENNLCEVYILNWTDDIAVGLEIEIELKQKIRDTKKFANFEELKLQIAKDVEFVKTCYNL